MTDNDRDQELLNLRTRVAALEAQRALNEEADEALEDAIRNRLPLDKALLPLLPILCRHVGGRAAWVRTFDERLELNDFFFETEPNHRFARPIDPLYNRVLKSGRYVKLLEAQTIVGQVLEVAGEIVGVVAVLFSGRLEDSDEQHRVADLLDVWSEEVDNFLAALALARHKHRVTRGISAALKEPVLEEGVNEAIRIIHDQLRFKEMVLVFRHEDDAEGTTLHYKIVRDGKIEHDSSAPTDPMLHELMHAEAVRLILGQPTVILDQLGIIDFREEALINGVRQRQVIGRIIVTNQYGEFSTFDRDLLERFAENIRLRIVDFNRQWKTLSLCFSPPVVKRVLQVEDYRRTILTPREADAAVMFVDIAGFTRISEFLDRPARIARLIDSWAEAVVQVLWDQDGVFDKMVGDCIIGMWSPPFFDMSPQEACRRAADAAIEIRKRTNELVESADLDYIPEPLQVSVGLNFCPLVVGYFGPNDNYTGFSSGMNNTARLQGLAASNEILCSAEFATALDDAERFGEERTASAKNVAEPLRFSPLLR